LGRLEARKGQVNAVLARKRVTICKIR
jgi:hypothetical protein